MAGDTSGSGAADRSGSGETGRPDDPWRRIETERPQRDAARRAWDAQHDPSPEFDHAIRPLGEDYGRDRPKHRELTDEQRAELEETFGRPADEILALRDNDPRAGHNRDEQGRILGPDGLTRPEGTPEQILREAQRQADRYGPHAQSDNTEAAEASDVTDRQPPSEHSTNTDTGVDDATADQPERDTHTENAPDLHAPTDTHRETSDRSDTDETGDTGDTGAANAGSGDNNGDSAGDAGHGDSNDGGDADEPGEPSEPGKQGDESDPNQPEDLGALVAGIASDLRSGKLTPREAADRLERFRDGSPPAAAEPTTDTVRTERTADGERRFERGTPVETDETTGERVANEQSDKVSRIRRKSNEVARSGEVVSDVKNTANIAEDAAIHRLPPGTHGETAIRQPDIPAIEARNPGGVDVGNTIAATLAVTIASVVLAQRLRDKISSRNNQQKE